MTLNVLKFSAFLTWSAELAVTGFQASENIGGMPAVSITPTLGASDCNQPHGVQGTLAFGASVTFNLNSLTTSLFNEVVNPSRFYIIAIYGTGATWSYAPGAALPFYGPLSVGAVLSFNDGAFMAFADPTATVIDNGTKNIKITNTHASDTLTYTLTLALGA